ncbi:MAG: SDR family NAD(P)-dependent oxidoreductase [Candidatus Bathyarchaeia archaeon]
MRLKDKVAIVTGGGSGIGECMCRALASEGSHVVVADVNEQTAKSTVEKLISLRDGRYLAVKVDVRSEEQVQQMVRRTIEEFDHIDILCANAGVVTMNWAIDITVEEWDLNMEVNAKGVFLCNKHVARQMIKQGKGGKIINTASMAGKSGFALESHYCASKFAVIGFTMALADELAPYKINVNAICPGIVDTPMVERGVQREAQLRNITPEKVIQKMINFTPLGRLAKTEDITGLVIFLASSESDFMTGQAINVTGGIEKH